MSAGQIKEAAVIDVLSADVLSRPKISLQFLGPNPGIDCQINQYSVIDIIR